MFALNSCGCFVDDRDKPKNIHTKTSFFTLTLTRTLHTHFLLDQKYRLRWIKKWKRERQTGIQNKVLQHGKKFSLVYTLILLLRSELEISASKVLASMTAWYTRRLSPSEATKHALGELLKFPKVVLKQKKSVVIMVSYADTNIFQQLECWNTTEYYKHLQHFLEHQNESDVTDRKTWRVTSTYLGKRVGIQAALEKADIWRELILASSDTPPDFDSGPTASTRHKISSLQNPCHERKKWNYWWLSLKENKFFETLGDLNFPTLRNKQKKSKGFCL